MTKTFELLVNDHAPAEQVPATPDPPEADEPDFEHLLSKFIKAAMKLIASGETQRCS